MPSHAAGVAAWQREDTYLNDHPHAGLTSAVNSPAPGSTGTDDSSDQLAALILASLDDDKAEDVVRIDLRGKSSIADYLVIASGRSTRQVAAMAEKMRDRIRTATGRVSRTEGMEAADWVLLDAGDVIVHIFRPEVREFYQLEKMWAPQGDPRARVAGSA